MNRVEINVHPFQVVFHDGNVGMVFELIAATEKRGEHYRQINRNRQRNAWARAVSMAKRAMREANK